MRRSKYTGFLQGSAITVFLLGGTMSLSLSGCAGDSARINALAPAITQAWPSVKEDALLGIASRNESEGVKAQRRGRVTEFDNALTTFNRGGQP